MDTILLHPSELAYAFSYTGTDEVIGWGATLASCPDDIEAPAWLEIGAMRLQEAGRLTGEAGSGLNFNDDMSAVFLALADPTVVLLSERKVEDGLRRMTVHAKGQDFIGLIRRADGLIEISRYSDLTAAAAASSAFLGASIEAADDDTHFTSRQELFLKLNDYAKDGRTAPVEAALVRLGVSEENATSFTNTLAKPAGSGMLSLFFCAGNVAQDADVFSVLTNKDKETWILFKPSGDDGPMAIERSSVAGLSARAVVSIGAHMAAVD